MLLWSRSGYPAVSWWTPGGSPHSGCCEWCCRERVCVGFCVDPGLRSSCCCCWSVGYIWFVSIRIYLNRPRQKCGGRCKKIGCFRRPGCRRLAGPLEGTSCRPAVSPSISRLSVPCACPSVFLSQRSVLCIYFSHFLQTHFPSHEEEWGCCSQHLHPVGLTPHQERASFSARILSPRGCRPPGRCAGHLPDLTSCAFPLFRDEEALEHRSLP